jgi:hypothetical protein
MDFTWPWTSVVVITLMAIGSVGDAGPLLEAGAPAHAVANNQGHRRRIKVQRVTG